MHKYFLIGFLLIKFFCFPFEAAAERFSSHVPYQVAVPEFVEALAQDVNNADVVNQDEFGQWHDTTKARLPELLDDLTQAIIDFEEQEFGEYNIDSFEDVSQKWNDIVLEYPDLEDIVPIVSPLIEEALEGFPALRSAKKSDVVPLQNVYEYHQDMLSYMPWGLQEFYRIRPLEDDIKLKTLEEILREKTVQGFKEVNVVKRETRVIKNGNPHFYELIEDDELVALEEPYMDPTLIHEILRRMIEDNKNPVIVSYVEWLVEQIDNSLNAAWQNGSLDDGTYRYMYGANSQAYFNSRYPKGLVARQYNDYRQDQEEDSIVSKPANFKDLFIKKKMAPVYVPVFIPAVTESPDLLLSKDVNDGKVSLESSMVASINDWVRPQDTSKVEKIQGESLSNAEGVVQLLFLVMFLVVIFFIFKGVFRVVKISISGVVGVAAR